MARPGEESVRMETGTQMVWPTVTHEGVVDLCAHHQQAAQSYAEPENRLLRDLGLPTVEHHSLDPHHGTCAECARMAQHGELMNHLELSMPPGYKRQQSDRTPRKNRWPSKNTTKPLEPLRQSQNAVQASWDDEDEYYEPEAGAPANWDDEYEYMGPDIHRGFPARLTKATHAIVHDSSRPVAERAHALVDALGHGYLGMHWTDDKGQAKEWAHGRDWTETQDVAHPDDRSGRADEDTHVVLHAHKPAREHIETDPDRLAEEEVYPYGEDGENEVPMKAGAPVRIKGVSWRPASGGQWMSHDFEAPMTHHAARDDEGLEPLPEKLYHVTTARDAVLEHGLKTRHELGQQYGHGLGGQEDHLISLTEHKPTAEHLLHSLHEYHDVLNGKLKLTELKEKARQGVGAKAPYDYMLKDHDDEELEAADRGRAIEHRMHDAREVGQDWHPLDEGLHGTGPKGEYHLHHAWDRPLSSDELLHKRSDIYKKFAWGRQMEGGHLDPLFVANDTKQFAAKDPGQFALLYVNARPGARGIQMNDRTEGTDAGEWRAMSGKDLDVVYHEGREDITPRHALRAIRSSRGAATNDRVIPAPGQMLMNDYPDERITRTAKWGDGGPFTWDEIGERHPQLYGDPEVHGEEADGADGEGIGEAANHLAHSTPDDPDAEGHMAYDLLFHEEHVDPEHIDYHSSGPSDYRVRHAYEGYTSGKPSKVPPLVLVHRHGVYQVADGHHRAEAAARAGKKVRAYVAYSPYPDVPSGDGDKAPYHGAEPHPGNNPQKTATRKTAVLHNPADDEHPHEWFHGSPYEFEEFADPAEHASSAYEEGPERSHWNTLLGTHFTAEHEVAHAFSGGEHHLTTEWDDNPNDQPLRHVIHAKLHLKNPKVYDSEHDMDQEVHEREYRAGNHISRYYDPEDREVLQEDMEDNPEAYHFEHEEEHPDAPYSRNNYGANHHPMATDWLNTHPKKYDIAARFKKHLMDQGYDGIVYGNEYEKTDNKPMRTLAAVAFHPHQIEITQHHYGKSNRCLTPQEARRQPTPGQEMIPGTEHYQRRFASRTAGSVSRLATRLPNECWTNYFSRVFRHGKTVFSAKTGAYYHGTSKQFEPGDVIDPSYELGGRRGKSYAFVTTDPQVAHNYAGHKADARRMFDHDAAPHAYEVEPLGRVEKDDTVDDRFAAWKSRHPFRVVREIFPGKQASRKTAAWDDRDPNIWDMDDEDDPYAEERRRKTQEWDDIHEGLGDIHRGVSVHLRPEDHAIVHDPRIPEHVRAQHLLKALPDSELAYHHQDNHLGRHWTDNEGVAESFGETDDRPNRAGWLPTSVVFHAHKPAREDIDEEPDQRDGMIFDYHDHGESEIPIRPGGSIHLKGLSWKNMDEPDSDYATAHGDGLFDHMFNYQHHHYGDDGPYHYAKTAMLKDPGLDALFASWDDDDDEDEDYEPDECEHCGHDKNDEYGHGEAHQDWMRDQKWYTDWDEERPVGEHNNNEIQRGMAISLPKHIHDVVHDEDRPLHERGKVLAEHVLKSANDHGHLGRFWTDEDPVSRSYALNSRVRIGSKDDNHTPATPVVVHVKFPGYHHIETDPDELEYHGVYSYGLENNREVPLQHGTPLEVKGVSWAHHKHGSDGTRHWDADNAEWHRHDFHEPIKAMSSKARILTAGLDALFAAWEQSELFHAEPTGKPHSPRDEWHQRMIDKYTPKDEDDEPPYCEECSEEHTPEEGHTECAACGERHHYIDTKHAHEAAYTDWDEVYPRLEDTLHRGMTVKLPRHVHDVVHDESRPVHERAQALADHLVDHGEHYGAGVGTHWTENPDQARHYTQATHMPGQTQFVLSIHKPEQHHIETDIDNLMAGEVLGYGEHEDTEIPIKLDAPLKVKSISWRPPTDTNFRHGDSGWVHHDFKEPMHMTAMRKHAHDSGDSQRIFHCFAGETRYLTREGVKTLAETVGTEQWVMTGSEDPRSGRWVRAIIHEFGEQPLLHVTLRRNKQTKVIRATAEHRWLVTTGKKRDRNRIVTTAELKKDHRLAQLRLPRFDGEPDREGIRMGAVFGDGTIQRRESGKTYGVITLWGAKRDLAKYFDEVATGTPTETETDGGVKGLRYSSGMAGYTKELPPLTASREYLLGWLMGYVATDGHVSDTGQVTLSASAMDDLQHVRDIATLLGIGTYAPTSKSRRGFGIRSMIHQMGFSASDLGEGFFLREDQRVAARAPQHERFGWTVVSVEDHGEVEMVYCPRVPGTESFALEDNIWTMNCPFCGAGQVIGRSDGTVECEFCHTAFTVQVQPQFNSFPQTINGMPVEIPGMPGQIDGAPGAPGTPPGLPGAPAGPPGADDSGNPFAGGDDDEGGPDDGSDDSGGDDDSGDDKKPDFLKSKSSLVFTSAFGDKLNEEQYVRHLNWMLTHARERL